MQNIVENLPAGNAGGKSVPAIRQAIVEPADEVCGNRPVIRISGGSLTENATEAEAILRAADVPIFRRQGRLVQPVRNTLRDSKGKEVQVAAIADVSSVKLRDEICRHADCMTYDKRAKEWHETNPTKEMADTVLARRGEGPYWRTLAGVTSTPIMRRDGSIAFAHGFDEATGMFLLDPIKLPNLPKRPSKGDALHALALLEALLQDFPFVDPGAEDSPTEATASAAVALSALLTPLARSAINVAPMHVARAPAAGTGKDYLFDLASAISAGTTCPAIAAGKDEEETEKRLGARILAGNPIICIGNVNGVLAGDLLCQVLSADTVAPRILSKSEAPDITNRFTVYANGNNITVAGDLTRRTLVCSLDAKMERPYEREFSADPFSMVLADRGRYVAAALTILCAHAVAGYPGAMELKPLNSFFDWTRAVRGALVWLGKADPVKTLDVARAEDPQRQERLEFIEALAGLFGYGRGAAVTTSRMIEESTKKDVYSDLPETTASRQRLAGVLARFADRYGTVNSRKLGIWLRGVKDNVVDGRRLESCDAGGHYQAWYIQDLKDS